ncbi:MAG: SRPBCC family protein [Planctomycetota bacterium]
MDFSNPFGIEYRVVEETTHEGQPARVVSGSAMFETDRDDLWEAVTSAERIPRWFLPISGELKPGGSYQLEGNAGGKIIRCDRPEAFEVTWECGGNVSWVCVRLESEATGTRLTLKHIMLKDEASEEHWRKYGPGATGVGWDLSFVGLSLHIRTGEAVLPRDAEAWTGTEEGKEFIRKCSAAWGDAHVQSGEEEAAAKSMADQTAEFYCGEA